LTKVVTAYMFGGYLS